MQTLMWFFFLESHKYSTSEIGVDIWSVNKAFMKNPQKPYRDCIWGELNRVKNETIQELHRNFHSGTLYSSRDCNISRVMALFLEEEKGIVMPPTFIFSIYMTRQYLNIFLKA